jgi:hypothetical protein
VLGHGVEVVCFGEESRGFEELVGTVVDGVRWDVGRRRVEGKHHNPTKAEIPFVPSYFVSGLFGVMDAC